MSDSEPNNQAPAKRGRGRPRKDPSAVPAKKMNRDVSNGASKGKRGRKPGSTNKPKAVSPNKSESQSVKRGRGRPRKSDADKKASAKKKPKKAESSESEGQDNSSLEDESGE